MVQDPDITQEEEHADRRPVTGKDDPNQGEGRPYSGVSQPEDDVSIDESTEGRPYSGVSQPEDDEGIDQSTEGRPYSGV
jgi:hypothetical protein